MQSSLFYHQRPVTADALSAGERELIQAHLDQRKAHLRRKYASVADIRLARHAVDILISATSAEELPEDFFSELLPENSLHIPLNVITGVQPVKPELTSGDGIRSNTFPDFDGTAGCFLSNPATNDKYLLTCGHVYSKGAAAGCIGRVADIVPVIASETEDALGNWWYALINAQLDVGLVALNEGVALDTSYLNTLQGVREVTTADVANGTAVTMHGYVSKVKTGTIVHVAAETVLGYSDGVLQMTNLIAVSGGTAAPYSPISTGGDSGSLLTDSQYVLGMVIGSNEQFTYAVPMTSILQQLQLAIYK